MQSFSKKVGLYALILSLLIVGFNLSVDPYDLFSLNLWGVETKAVTSHRFNKWQHINGNPHSYEAFILSSSHGMKLVPEVVQEASGYNTFHYGVSSALPEDYYAIMQHILKAQSPKLVVLVLDFYALNDSIVLDDRLRTSPLFDYLQEDQSQIWLSSWISDRWVLGFKRYFSLDAFLYSVKILYNDKFGVKKSQEVVQAPVNKDKVPLCKGYFGAKYRNYKISKKRVDYLKRFKKLADDNGVKLRVIVSPMHTEHFEILYQDQHLRAEFLKFKQKVHDIFPEYLDFNNYAVVNYEEPGNWDDSVHISTRFGPAFTKKVMNSALISDDFGIKVTEQNVEPYLEKIFNPVIDILKKRTNNP